LAIALALGVAGLPAGRRTRVALLFAGFEAGMPLVGLALGVPLGNAIGRVADLVAAGLLAGLGGYLLVAEEDEDRLLGMTGRGPLAAISLGASISLDELAIGFSAGLLRLPVAPMVIAIAVQAFVVTQVGVRLGGRIGRRWHERAEQLAGLSLIALGAILLILNLTG
jgi:putative Mn2+ efflux pump MntP